jgi:hypothetical protein
LSSPASEQRGAHTPGPWTATEENCGGGLNIRGPRGERVGFTGQDRNAKGEVIVTEQAMSNAALMASAPALKAEVERLRELVGTAYREGYCAAAGGVCDADGAWLESESRTALGGDA